MKRATVWLLMGIVVLMLVCWFSSAYRPTDTGENIKLSVLLKHVVGILRSPGVGAQLDVIPVSSPSSESGSDSEDGEDGEDGILPVPSTKNTSPKNTSPTITEHLTVVNVKPTVSGQVSIVSIVDRDNVDRGMPVASESLIPCFYSTYIANSPTLKLLHDEGRISTDDRDGVSYQRFLEESEKTEKHGQQGKPLYARYALVDALTAALRRKTLLAWAALPHCGQQLFLVRRREPRDVASGGQKSPTSVRQLLASQKNATLTFVYTNSAEHAFVEVLRMAYLKGGSGIVRAKPLSTRQAQAEAILLTADQPKENDEAIVGVVLGTVASLRASLFVHAPSPDALCICGYDDGLDLSVAQHMFPFLYTTVIDVVSLSSQVDQGNQENNNNNDTTTKQKAKQSDGTGKNDKKQLLPELHTLLHIDTLLMSTRSTRAARHLDSTTDRLSEAKDIMMSTLLGNRGVMATSNYYEMLSNNNDADDDSNDSTEQSKSSGTNSKSIRFSPQATRLLAEANRRNQGRSPKTQVDAVGRPEVPILEQFAEQGQDHGQDQGQDQGQDHGQKEEREEGDYADIVPSSKMEGVYLRYAYNGQQKVMEVDGNTIDGLRISRGDRVVLRHQEREDENGAYIVDSADPKNGSILIEGRIGLLSDTVKMDLPMGPSQDSSVSPVSPSPSPGSQSKSLLRSDSDCNSNKLTSNDDEVIVLQGVVLQGPASTWRVNDKVILPQLGNEEATFVSPMNETPDEKDTERSQNTNILAMVRLSLAATRKSQREFSCVTNNSLKSRAACVSAFDAFGEAKPGGPDVWDRPCEKNTDCPFFQANTAYRNYRGGCISGHCEMPLGVERVGYTQYMRTGGSFMPLCHGCAPDADSQQTCCASQQKDKDQSGGKGPQFAFPMDQFERHGANSATMVTQTNDDNK